MNKQIKTYSNSLIETENQLIVANGRVGAGAGKGRLGDRRMGKKLSVVELSLIFYPIFSVKHF